MHKTWEWLKQLTRSEEQIFRRAREPIDSVENEGCYKSYGLFWSLSDLVLITACFQIDAIYFCDMSYMFKNDIKPGFIQIMVMYATWGPALIYMEVFLGQYIRHGCLYLKNMVPLACSTIGYGMLLTIYLYSVASVERLADTYMFFFRSFGSELPWMICPEGSTPATCIDRTLLLNCYLENRQQECYPKLGTELLSSRIYYKATHSTFVKRAGLLLVGWLTVYITLKQSLSNTLNMMKRFALLIIIFFLCLFMPLASHIAQGLSIAPFFNLRIAGLLNLKAWLAAFKDFLRDHAIVRGGYQLIGCRIKPGPTTANLAICSCALTYMITVICQMFSTGILGVLLFYMKVTNAEEELFFPEYAKLFNFYPFALGMLPVRQVWSLIYFMFVALLSTSYTILNMAVLEESIYDNFPVVLRYRSYVKVAICALGFLIGVFTDLVIDIESSAYEDEPVLKIGQRLTIVILLILTISVGYVYGVEQFSDDINFLNGSQPNTYWKICWKSLPFGILILFGGEVIDLSFPSDNVSEMASNIVYVILLIVALLFMLRQIVMSIKARNVTGLLFQATMLWGPPSDEDRRMRRMYNPREETKYWRKNNQCTHHCLIGKDILLSIIHREIDSRTNRARHNDTLQQDMTAVTKSTKQKQEAFSINKVSSEELENFEEQVNEKLKFLQKVEEMEAELKQEQVTALRNDVAAVKSMDEMDNRIEQMIDQAERRALLKTEHSTSSMVNATSKVKQHRLPLFVPKETPRPKNVTKTRARAETKNKRNKEFATFQTHVVHVPNFVLEQRIVTLQSPKTLKSTEQKGNSRYSEFPMTEKNHNEKLQAQDDPTQATNHSTIGTVSPPREPMSLDIFSTRSALREGNRPVSDDKMSTHGLPPNVNLARQAFSVDVHRSGGSPKTLEGSMASSELSLLNHDPVLRDIIRSVHPDIFKIGTVHGLQAPVRTSSDVLTASPLPEKHKSKRPSIVDSRVQLRHKRIICESVIQKTGHASSIKRRIVQPLGRSNMRGRAEVSGREKKKTAADADEAIKISIDRLLSGVQDLGPIKASKPINYFGISIATDSNTPKLRGLSEKKLADVESSSSHSSI